MKKGGGINHGPSGLEVLDLESEYIHDWNDKEYVRIGIVEEDAKGENGVISLVLVQFNQRQECSALQASLTKNEIDYLMNGLKVAKDRLLELGK